MMTLKWLAMLVAAVLASAFLAVWASPVAYLKMQSRIGFAPISVSWALQRASSDLVTGSDDFCQQPVLFAWHGSFGGGPVLRSELSIPDTAEFEEVVLFRSGVVNESTQMALDEMATFNEIVLSQCLLQTGS